MTKRAFDKEFQSQVVQARTYKRKKPTWVWNDKKIRDLIVRAFPKMETSRTQRESAARWASVIHLYFRMGYTRAQIAEEIGSTTGKIHGIIRSISRVSKGLRADGTGRLKSNMPHNRLSTSSNP